MTFLRDLIRDERTIGAGIGLLATATIGIVYFFLEAVQDSNEVTLPPPKATYITQETEDSLQPDTLESLLGHYNYAIREVASKIVCDRALNDPATVDFLLWGITRPDYDERFRSLRTLALITDQAHLSILHTPKAYSALVRSLEFCALEFPCERMLDPHHDDYYLRDMAEKFCLMFVAQLIKKYDPELLIKARFVEKWLARQPWGEGEAERQHNYSQYVSRRLNRISEVCRLVKESYAGRKALQDAGLITKEEAAGSEVDECGNHHEAARLSLVLSITGEAIDLHEVETYQPRVLEQSAEEQRLRRQHREAMVLNDGTRPLGRGDIIERGHD
ncbi:hypothetical protein MGG_04471 [Pyricularia oryzae 70-15]|uniref:Cytoskeleton-associated protein n=3 Tax=Pyricularia oryzae TaxID=318829 RepID=G4MKJ5_PYRO7|nr:uncharacterized protein MGG_04471 [Pyricularia oryzae 70-15]EHA58378.1 hypothetical protein MGG_04471 [Pyricularia oryzae 70-15]ELQ33065.1 hypothetical protein OOU_Y34scaffold01005g91 [Pyricularia oryzae Y34]KAI7928566.1 hypothetical protein M0657_002674 [Pyricularia oryzae]